MFYFVPISDTINRISKYLWHTFVGKNSAQSVRKAEILGFFYRLYS